MVPRQVERIDLEELHLSVVWVTSTDIVGVYCKKEVKDNGFVEIDVMHNIGRLSHALLNRKSLVSQR